MENILDCRSEESITIGLIDTIINSLYILSSRDKSSFYIQEALKDLLSAPELYHLLQEIKEK